MARQRTLEGRRREPVGGGGNEGNQAATLERRGRQGTSSRGVTGQGTLTLLGKVPQSNGLRCLRRAGVRSQSIGRRLRKNMGPWWRWGRECNTCDVVVGRGLT